MECWVRIQLSTDYMHQARSFLVGITHKHLWDLWLPWILKEYGINQILESSVDYNPFDIAPGVCRFGFFFRESMCCAKRRWCSLMELPLECSKEQGTCSSGCAPELKVNGLKVHWRTQTGKNAYSMSVGDAEHIISLF